MLANNENAMILNNVRLQMSSDMPGLFEYVSSYKVEPTFGGLLVTLAIDKPKSNCVYIQYIVKKNDVEL